MAAASSKQNGFCRQNGWSGLGMTGNGDRRRRECRFHRVRHNDRGLAHRGRTARGPSPGNHEVEHGCQKLTLLVAGDVARDQQRHEHDLVRASPHTAPRRCSTRRDRDSPPTGVFRLDVRHTTTLVGRNEGSRPSRSRLTRARPDRPGAAPYPRSNPTNRSNSAVPRSW